jgi:hypothetical protein
LVVRLLNVKGRSIAETTETGKDFIEQGEFGLQVAALVFNQPLYAPAVWGGVFEFGLDF